MGSNDVDAPGTRDTDGGRAKRTRKYRDEEGVEVVEGCTIFFVYGIPPVRVKAPVIERDGRLIALTHGHNPTECPVSQLKKHVGEFWVMPPIASASSSDSRSEPSSVGVTSNTKPQGTT